jgi:hypothetical protein
MQWCFPQLSSWFTQFRQISVSAFAHINKTLNHVHTNSVLLSPIQQPSVSFSAGKHTFRAVTYLNGFHLHLFISLINTKTYDRTIAILHPKTGKYKCLKFVPNELMSQ